MIEDTKQRQMPELPIAVDVNSYTHKLGSMKPSTGLAIYGVSNMQESSTSETATRLTDKHVRGFPNSTDKNEAGAQFGKT